MDFHTDEHFQIGKDHATSGKPCQDYALSDLANGRAYAIVSDGCSSGERTDIGARLVCLAAATALREHAERGSAVTGITPREIALHEQIVLTGIRRTLGLSRADLLATCLTAYLTPTVGFVHLEGDGAVATMGKDQSITLWKYEWQNNTPFYPSYRDATMHAFIQAHGGDLEAPTLTVECWNRTSEADEWTLQANDHSLADGIDGITLELDPSELQYVAVFSDGVTQVDGIDWKDAVLKLLAFKSLEGAFAKRRMIRFVHEAQRTGRGPQDDIAYAVIRVDTSNHGGTDDTIEPEH